MEYNPIPDLIIMGALLTMLGLFIKLTSYDKIGATPASESAVLKHQHKRRIWMMANGGLPMGNMMQRRKRGLVVSSSSEVKIIGNTIHIKPAEVGRVDMSDVKWTPGPWHADTAGRPMVARVGDFHIRSDSEHPSVQTERPDANLIAAAPELYEALKAIVNKTSRGLDLGMKVADLWDEIIEAERAMAKARGES